jgi:hypothetical protein
MLAAALAVAGALFGLVCWLQAMPPWQAALALVVQGNNLGKVEVTEYEYDLRADVARLLVGEGDTLTSDQWLVAIGAHAVLAVIVAVLVGAVLARVRRLEGHAGLRFGLVAATMLVVAPSAHASYYVFLLPGLTAGLADLLQRPPSRPAALLGAGLAAGTVFSGLDQPFILAQRALGVGGIVTSHWLTWHLPTLALLVALVTLSAMLMTACHQQS